MASSVSISTCSSFAISVSRISVTSVTVSQVEPLHFLVCLLVVLKQHTVCSVVLEGKEKYRRNIDLCKLVITVHVPMMCKHSCT